MAWVRTVYPKDADGEILEAYRELTGEEHPERMAHVIASTSIRPRIMLAMSKLNDEVNFENHSSGLTRLQREMISSVVSTTNECRY
jgi:hypothetical protein